MLSLTERQQTILTSAVDAHIESAQPIGSHLLLETYGLGYSSATIRHEMGELEQLGYLEQPHVSAGRVPTDAGYRFYVDHGLEKKSGLPEVTGRILERYSGLPEQLEAEQLAESAVGFIASLLRETGVILLVEHDPVSGFPRRRRLFIQGTCHILEKPEFQDLAKVKALFKTLEEKQSLMDTLNVHHDRVGAQVRIGHENPVEPLYGCSVVQAGYRSGPAYSGAIAVIGPRRMRYARILQLVEEMTRVLKQALCEKEKLL